MKKILLSLCAICIILAGCNTLQGVGKDIESSGESIQRAAE